MAIKVAAIGVAVIAIVAAIIMGPDAFLGGEVGTINASNNNLTVDGVVMPNQIKTSGTLQNFIGGGLRMKWGFKVYVVGIYSDPKVMTSLKKKYSGFEAKDSKNLSDLATDFASSKPARTVLLRFQRGVAASDISDALGEALKPKVGAATSDEFQQFVLDIVGGDRLEKGSDIYITCKGEKLSASLTGGKDSSSISIKGLCPAVFEVYLGDKAVSPQAKKGFAEGVATIMAS
mmetsp:Transcript_27784/g.39764  ORF Transcript_27784/g.39764 Transcript_27784/m.39764 type:complete len:232 (+) Transcript_27784:45-740(+)